MPFGPRGKFRSTLHNFADFDRKLPGFFALAVVHGLDFTRNGNFNPLFQMPHSGVHFSSFVSWSFGTPECPLSDIPLQTIIDRVAERAYQAKPARVLRFEDIQEAHRLLETNEVGGKIVVRV